MGRDARFLFCGGSLSGYWQFPRSDRQQMNRQTEPHNTRRGQLRSSRRRKHPRRPPAHYPSRGRSRSVLDFERWVEPPKGDGYRVLVEPPGKGWYHVLSERDIRSCLSQLPSHLLTHLHTVYLPRMTHKRQRMSCYGLQYGGTIYLYPLPADWLKWTYKGRVKSDDRIWMLAAGASIRSLANHDEVSWTAEALRFFYRENVLLHELGHIIDTWNNSTVQRERFANFFAQIWGQRKN